MNASRLYSRSGLWAIAALVAGCGGGTESGGNLTDTRSGPVAQTGLVTGTTASETSADMPYTQAAKAKLPVLALTFTTPADKDVLTVGKAVGVAAQIRLDGAVPPDRTAVRFGAPAATLVPLLPQALAGTVKTSFTATAAGPQAITAAVQIGSQTTTSLRSVFVRPAPSPLQVLVPAYFSPDDTPHWDTMTAGAAAYPNLAVTAIVNPNNGIFTLAEPGYLRALAQFAAVGGKTVGYVYTGYGTGSRSLVSIKANIDNYLALYGRNLIAGFFLDEMASDPSRIGFYQEIYRHIKARDAGLRVIGNPGTVPDALYATVADTLVTFENRATAYSGYDPRQGNPWLYLQPNLRQAALVHNAANCAAMQRAVGAAATARYNAGPVYVTNLKYNPDTGVGDPWKALPAYWVQLLATVSAVNQGAALPAC